MSSSSERTLLIVKPDGVQRGLVGEIIARWERKGFKLVGLKFCKASEEQASQHYSLHKERPFFKSLVSFLSSSPIVLMCFEGLGVIAASRLMIGATNPLVSAPGTVRGDFAVQIDKNIIHGSDSVEASEREISLWFSKSEILDWDYHPSGDIYA